MNTATPAEFLSELKVRDFANGHIVCVIVETTGDTFTFSQAEDGEEGEASNAFLDKIGEAINALIADVARLRVDEDTGPARVVTLDYAGGQE